MSLTGISIYCVSSLRLPKTEPKVVPCHPFLLLLNIAHPNIDTIHDINIQHFSQSHGLVFKVGIFFHVFIKLSLHCPSSYHNSPMLQLHLRIQMGCVTKPNLTACCHLEHQRWPLTSTSPLYLCRMHSFTSSNLTKHSSPPRIISTPQNLKHFPLLTEL